MLDDLIRIGIMNEVYDYFDEISNDIREGIKYTLEYTRSPHRISFETDSILMYFERSYLVSTYDFFLLDDEHDVSISESSVAIEEIPEIKAAIYSSIYNLTTKGSKALLKGKTQSLLNRIKDLRKKRYNKPISTTENVRKEEKSHEENFEFGSNTEEIE